MIIPALAAVAESAKTAPATANLMFLFIYFSYCFLKPHQLLDEKVRELSQ
jgi:hypothetical protein